MASKAVHFFTKGPKFIKTSNKNKANFSRQIELFGVCDNYQAKLYMLR